MTHDYKAYSYLYSYPYSHPYIVLRSAFNRIILEFCTVGCEEFKGVLRSFGGQEF